MIGYSNVGTDRSRFLSAEIPIRPAGPSLRELDERSREIFRSIVESYLATGEPVVMPTADDARMRLDHLARRLDERLRQAETPPIGPDRATADLTSDERP